jgi:aspartyl/asparaginyl-tRNA synthetase/glutathione S-transferase
LYWSLQIKYLQLLAASIYGNVSLTRSTDIATSNSIDISTPPCTSSTSLCLELQGVTTCFVSSTNAGLRWIAGTVPSINLLGEVQSEQAIVDSWLSFAWSSIDLPMEVLLRSSSSGVNDTTGSTSAFIDSLRLLDKNLTYTTYLAGGKGLSIADIRILSSLWLAATSKLWDPEITETNDDNTTIELGNLKRWYQTLIHQEWFITSVGMLPNITASTLTTATRSLSAAPAVNASSGSGVELNGSPTPVVNKMYRRNRIRIKELLGQDEGVSYIGQTVTLAGWSRTIRKASSKLIFVEINDGSVGESIQCVLDTTTEGFEECKNSGGTGSSFSFIGQVVASGGGDQKIDVKVTQATLLGAVYGGNPEGTVVGGMLYPLSKKEHTLEFLRDIAHLRPRGRIHAAAMRIRHAMAYATHTFFHNHGFLYVHTPILTGADCEGAGEQFGVTTMLGSDHLKPDITIPIHKPPAPPTIIEGSEDGEQPKMSKSEMKRLAKQKAKGKTDTGPIPGTGPVEPETVVGAVDYGQDFFCQRMNLTVSGQLNVETHACALSDVYTFGPTFRAEESRTYRHLAEFWMIEPEIAFATLKEDIDLAEDYLKYCVQFALEHCSDDLEFFENNPHGEKGLRDRLKNVLNNEFKVRETKIVVVDDGDSL